MDIIYLHQRRDWPEFRWREDAIVAPLAAVRHRQGKLLGQMGALGFELRNEAVLATLTTDVVKSSQIEGENLDQAQVRSSIARRLGMEIAGLVPADRNVDGVVEMMLDASPDLFGHWIISLHWGRIGTKGQSRMLSFNRQCDAARFVKRTLSRRASARERIGAVYSIVI
jgi:Domain of unknown function (DUF4172)/WGR domain